MNNHDTNLDELPTQMRQAGLSKHIIEASSCMLFLITGDDSSANLWYKAICDAVEFRKIANSYYIFHPKPEIKGEILKIIHDLGCEDFCELLENDDLGIVNPEFIVYSLSKNHEFYNFCLKCHEDSEFSRQMTVGNICVGEQGFYDERMSNSFFYEIILLFCVLNFIIAYLFFFRK